MHSAEPALSNRARTSPRNSCEVNVTTSQSIANLPYDRFFAPASTTSSTKAEEAEQAEADEVKPVPSISSRQRDREVEENWMPKAVLFSMACVLSLLVADDPGVTRSIDWYKCSRLPLDVIDLPGYGYAKEEEPSSGRWSPTSCKLGSLCGSSTAWWTPEQGFGRRTGGFTRRGRTKDSEPERGAMATRKATPGPEAQAQRLVVDPVHLVSWGGGLMPPVSSLEPRIREKALYSFYLPKLAEDGHSDEVLNRCVAPGQR
eukprot:s5329_g4.t1